MLGMCTDPRYFELFVSSSKYQHSNLFEQFEQYEEFVQFRQFRPFTPFETTKSLITTNWKFQMPHQNATNDFIQCNLVLWGFREPCLRIWCQNSEFKMADANGKQIAKHDLISMKFGTRRLSRSLITHLNLKFKKANLV